MQGEQQQRTQVVQRCTAPALTRGSRRPALYSSNLHTGSELLRQLPVWQTFMAGPGHRALTPVNGLSFWGSRRSDCSIVDGFAHAD